MQLARIFLFSFILALSVFPQIDKKAVDFKGRFYLDNTNERIQTFKFLENGKKLLLVGGLNFQLWDVESGEVLKVTPHKINGLHKGGPWVLSPDGKRLLVFNRISAETAEQPDNFMSIWNVETGDLITVFDKGKYPEQLGKWSKNGETLITADNSLFFLADYIYEDRRSNVAEGILLGVNIGNSKISLWDGETLEHRADIQISDVSWYHLSHDGETLFTTQGEKKKLLGIPYSSEKADFISVWNTKDAKLIKQIPIGDDLYFVRTRKMQVSPDGQYLALIQKSRKSSSNDKLLIWKMDEFDKEPKFSIRANPVFSDSDLVYSPDSKFVAVEAGGKVQIYELATGEMAFSLKKTEMPDLWLANNSVAVDINQKNLKAFDIRSDRQIYQRWIAYEEVSRTDYSGVPDANGNYPTESEVINFTRFSVRKNGSEFLSYDKTRLELVDSLTGRSIVRLITPQYDLAKKKFSGKELLNSAGWTDDGQYIFAVNEKDAVIEVWKYLR